MFTCRVYGRARGAHETCHRGHVDDSAATFLFEHLLNFVFEAEPDSLQIDVHDTVKVFLGLIDNGNPFAFNAGIVKGDVEAAKFVDSFVDERLDIGGFRNVGFYEEGVAARGADEFGGFRSFKFAATCNDDFGARLGKEYGGIAANAGGATGHDGDLVA